MQVIGHIGNDAVVRDANGKTVINFSVAHTEKYKTQAGVLMEKTTWVECAYWTERIAIAPYLLKGMQIYCEGTPGADCYTNKEGQPIAKLKLNVFSIQLLGAKKDNSPVVAQHSVATPTTNSNTDAVDDLPF